MQSTMANLAACEDVLSPVREYIISLLVTIDKLQDENDRFRSALASDNSLESYCFTVKSTIEDENIRDKVSKSEMETVLNKCAEINEWLLTKSEESENKQKELENLWNPILIKLFQGAGDAPSSQLPEIPISVTFPDPDFLNISPKSD